MKFKDFSILFILISISWFLSYYLKLNFFFTTLLFILPQIVYLLYNNIKNIKRVFLFTLVIILFLVIVFDYIAIVNQAWIVNSMFSYYFLWVVPIEDFVRGFLMLFYIILFYENFIIHKFRFNYKRFIKFSYLLVVLLLLFLTVYFIDKNLLIVNSYVYFLIGIVIILLPLFFFLYRKPWFIKQICPIILFIMFFNLLFEIIWISLNNWTFPWKYLFVFSVMWKILPIEEIVFYIVISSVSFTYLYEYFLEKK